ncbi:MAG: hypothetical protein ACE5JS_10775 [Nitrospinota bacterium]
MAASGLALLAIGCSNVELGRLVPSNVAATVRPDIRKYNLRHIAVMPFRNATDSPDAGNKVAGFFYTELSTRKTYSVTPPVRLDKEEEIELEFRVDPSRRAGTVNREENLRLLGRAVSKYLKTVQPYTTTNRLIFPGEFPESDPEEERTPLTGEVRSPEVTAGEEIQALDAVVTGVISRYNNRDGNPLAAERPASVSFDIYLISVQDGKVLWSATFDETQEFLNENLLLIGRFIQGGGVWQSHDTLARIGMARVLETFPGIGPSPREGAPAPTPSASP